MEGYYPETGWRLRKYLNPCGNHFHPWRQLHEQ
jgi:hypothetical protein